MASPFMLSTGEARLRRALTFLRAKISGLDRVSPHRPLVSGPNAWRQVLGTHLKISAAINER